jgi:hypothetical protein
MALYWFQCKKYETHIKKTGYQVISCQIEISMIGETLIQINGKNI